MSGVTGPLADVDRDDFLRGVVEELKPANERWPGLWTRLESLLNERDRLERHVQDVDARLAALYAANEQLHRDRDLMIERSAAWRVRAESSERHVQDMESAIEEWAFDQGYDSLSAERIAVDIRNRAAALPAREKEEE